jgi:predicted HicB family RNase H-like nuclease
MDERRHTDQPVPVDRRRGRPRSEDPTETFTIRITRTQRQKLTVVASLNGLSLSAFIREAIDEVAADCSDDRIFR